MSIVLAVVWISLFCCLTAIAYFLVQARSAAPPRRRKPLDPEQILAERYALGELDEVEYAQRLSVLREGPPLHAYLDR